MILSKKTQIIDISPTISERLAVFPGDKTFERHVSLDMHKGDNLSLSSITSTLHIGAHADAPSHYAKNGQSIDERSLEFYLGTCQVLRLETLKKGARIVPKDIEEKIIQAPRILFYTASYDEERWSNDFNSLSPELIKVLHKKGVQLIGIDTPSVDPASSKLLESHTTLAQLNLAVLECLVLKHVPEGIYTLIALPLKIEAGEASPLRAVLLKENS